MEIKKGFSIVELVVVIGLTSLLALGISAVLLTTITSSTRVRALTHIKQSGDRVTTQLQTFVRNSRTINSCDENTGTLILETQEGTTHTISGGNALSLNGNNLFPADLEIINFVLTCEPDGEPTRLVTFNFDLKRTITSSKVTENPVLHFTISADLRND